MDAEHAAVERLVAPTLWPSLSAHVVASPGSRAALEVGGLTVIVSLFQNSTAVELDSAPV